MKKISAFTLVEVIMVVAIIGIISAIAYPSYEQYITRSKRADAMGALMNADQAMQRYKVNNYNYNIGTDLSRVFATQVPVDGGTPYYQLSIRSDNSSYSLVATPVGSMAGKDGRLSLESNGFKHWTDKNGVTHTCWPESGNQCP